MITVSASLPGADPATVASSLAAPLERRFGQIAGVTEMTRSARWAAASITLQFDLNRKVDGAARDVQAAINAAASDLPINLPNPPTYRKVNPADAPIMILAMTSDTLPQSQIYEFADAILGQKLEPGRRCQPGDHQRRGKIRRARANQSRRARLRGFSLEDVRSFLGQVNVNRPKGSFEGEQDLLHHLASNDQITDPSRTNI